MEVLTLEKTQSHHDIDNDSKGSIREEGERAKCVLTANTTNIVPEDQEGKENIDIALNQIVGGVGKADWGQWIVLSAILLVTFCAEFSLLMILVTLYSKKLDGIFDYYAELDSLLYHMIYPHL